MLVNHILQYTNIMRKKISYREGVKCAPSGALGVPIALPNLIISPKKFNNLMGFYRCDKAA